MKIRKKSLNKKKAYTTRIQANTPKIYRRHQSLPFKNNRSYITPMISQAQKSKSKLRKRLSTLADHTYGDRRHGAANSNSDDEYEYKYESFNDSRMQNPLKRPLMRSNSIVMTHPMRGLNVNDGGYGAVARNVIWNTNYPQLHNGSEAVPPTDLGIDYSEYINVQPLPTIRE